MSIFIRNVPNVMRHFGCSADDAQRYIDLREEGYGNYEARLMAGLSDPPDPEAIDRHLQGSGEQENGNAGSEK